MQNIKLISFFITASRVIEININLFCMPWGKPIILKGKYYNRGLGMSGKNGLKIYFQILNGVSCLFKMPGVAEKTNQLYWSAMDETTKTKNEETAKERMELAKRVDKKKETPEKPITKEEKLKMSVYKSYMEGEYNFAA